jgi:hypothetical protein
MTTTPIVRSARRSRHRPVQASSYVNGAAHAPGSVLTTASIERKWLDNWLIAATFEGDLEIHQQSCRQGRVRYRW